MFLLDLQSFILYFSDPQAWHNFSLFCGTGSNCLVLLRLLSFISNVWLVFSLVILLDSGLLLICKFSKEWIVVSNSKLTLLSDVTCSYNSSFVFCIFNMASLVCWSFSASNLLSYWFCSLFWFFNSSLALQSIVKSSSYFSWFSWLSLFAEFDFVLSVLCYLLPLFTSYPALFPVLY